MRIHWLKRHQRIQKQPRNQVQAVLDKLKNQNKSNLNQYVDLYWNHLASYYKNGKVEQKIG